MAWKETGLVKASSLRRVGGRSNAERMIARLEDMVASLGGRIRRALELKPSPTDLLRDFRLALIRRDDDSARQLLDEVRLNAHVSAENLRYLRLEYLAAFERWADMRKLPHLGALLQARRPRAISETLFRMVWWTELAGIDTRNAYAAFVQGNVVGLMDWHRCARDLCRRSISAQRPGQVNIGTICSKCVVILPRL